MVGGMLARLQLTRGTVRGDDLRLELHSHLARLPSFLTGISGLAIASYWSHTCRKGSIFPRSLVPLPLDFLM